jgi:phosphomevalonate kinase
MTVRQFGLGALVALAAFALAPAARAGEMVDNPEYKMWSGFKAGSSVTMKMVTEASGMKTEMEQTTTLLEISGDKAVLETKGKMVVSGNAMDMPAQKRDVPAKVEKVAGGEGKAPEVKESNEEVSVGGKSLKCKKTESTSESNGMKTTSMVWMSDEIPGGTAKMESSTTGAATSKTVMEAVKWEAKK